MEKPKRIKVYPKTAVAPYIVYIRRVKCPINVFHIADFLSSTYKTASETKLLNEHKVQITFDNRKEANHFLQSSSSIRSSFDLYAPAHRVEIDGVVYNKDIDIAEVKRKGLGVYNDKNISAVPILDVSCLIQSPSDGRGNKGLPAIRITFATTVLPDYLKIGTVLLPVRIFYHKPMLCVLCKQYGHTAQYCCNRICCSKCGRDHPDESCSLNTNVCFKCKTEHALLGDCLVLQKKHIMFQNKQRRTRKMMYADLKDQCARRSKNSPELQENHIHESTPTQQCVHKKGNSSSSTKKETICSISQLVSLLCNTFIHDLKIRRFIIALTPAFVQFWKNQIVKFPPLEHFISAN